MKFHCVKKKIVKFHYKSKLKENLNNDKEISSIPTYFGLKFISQLFNNLNLNLNLNPPSSYSNLDRFFK